MLIRFNKIADFKANNVFVKKAIWLINPKITKLVSINKVINKLFAFTKKSIELTEDLSKYLI